MGRQRALALDDKRPATRHWEIFHEMLLAERNASENTREAYCQDLIHVEKTLGQQGDLADASVVILRGYLESLSRQKLAPATAARRLSALRQ